ncbi:cobalamin biosynthesis protein [Neorhizobium sp. P12A]|jgi:adenosylcobinamide-phosphate synthase|uniref:adenosylcobinamide-phosphate synthase CbiB n=1 Tax=Rhizobium/Agrobacterium group TaxID=227290 RepID=UPI001044CCFF|nr:MULTISPECIES: adenosylcobinamide-phosphate synthase CbiB [Rhizobium/Agrobacterium group]KAA0700170.1 cobalamin biosynthesis protein [Neorhizobium sp. P12A]TCR83836.1 adenosylcobinamide-phosphate synthase [Rhizobium sp. BK376]
MIIDEHLLILVLALILDRILGDPDWLWSRMSHPVVVFGKLIEIFDRRFNLKHLPGMIRRRNGIMSIVALLFIALIAGWAVHGFLAFFGWLGIMLEALLVAVFMAQKSLADHVNEVSKALRSEGLEGGRAAVSRIVGRDPETLDEAGICRAAIESLAENFSDGVVAPALWYAVFGLPGLFIYKMLNTADSMIGHKSETYIDFGWAAARLDDLANWPAARLSILLIAVGAFAKNGLAALGNTIRVAVRDGGLHRSPNSGRPEAAMAGALDIQLAGPRVYGGEMVREPMINGAGRDIATVSDIEAGVSIFYSACSVLVALAFVAFLMLL